MSVFEGVADQVKGIFASRDGNKEESQPSPAVDAGKELGDVSPKQTPAVPEKQQKEIQR